MNARYLLILAALVACTGCYNIRYVTHAAPQAVPSAEEWHHNAIAGLWEVSAPVNVSQICPNGFAEVHNQVSFVNGLVAGLVQGAINGGIQAATRDPATGVSPYYVPFTLWSPQTVRVTCAGTRAELTPPQPLSPEQQIQQKL